MSENLNYLNNLVKNNGLKVLMREGFYETGLRELCYYIKNNIGPVKNIVEIGSYMGESAAIFAQEFPDTNIICIDPWEGNYDELDSASSTDFVDVENQFDMRATRYPNITKLKGYSTDYKISCDIVYIDGCHTYECVKEDILHWQKLASKAICGHDYFLDERALVVHKHIAGVRKAVDEILNKPDAVFPDTSWIYLKK
jgi:hypothetical protein